MSEEVFQQIPWFASTGTGTLDLNTSFNYQEENIGKKTKTQEEKRASTATTATVTSPEKKIESSRQGSADSKLAWDKQIPASDEADIYIVTHSESKVELLNQDNFRRPHKKGADFTMDGKLNANRYATKKTISQGLLDVALLTSNASQLKYVLTVGAEHQFYEVLLALIITSIILQAFNGVCQLIMGPLDFNKEDYKTFLNFVNHLSMFLSLSVVGIDVIKMGFGLGENVF